MRYLELFEDYIKKNFSEIEAITKSKYISAMKLMDIDECVEYVIEKCTEFINKPIYITRYIKTVNTDTKFPFKSNPVERVSRDNTNHYTLLIDNSENWKKYPKRSKSFICSLHKKMHLVSPYLPQNSYLVIPNDESIWGICPTDDILTSFNTLLKYGHFTEVIFESMNKISIRFDLGGISDSNIVDMKNDLLKLQKYIYNRYKTTNDFLDIIDPLDKTKYFCDFVCDNWGLDIWECLETVFNPITNNFKVNNYTNIIPSKIYNDIEIWTESPCIFIPIGDLKLFLKKLRDKTKKEILL
jgi:hypothetical protein